jgi:PAS domain S-box-containing protein
MNPPIDTNNRLVKLLPGVYYLLELFDDWRMVSVSDNSTEIFGYTPNEIISWPQLITDKVIHVDDLQSVIAKKRNSLMDDTLFAIEYRIKCKNGDVKYVRDQFTCYISDDGRWTMEGYIHEVRHLETRDLLLEQLQAYRNAVDVNMISSITDKKGTIIYANDNFCRVSKYTSRELIGQNHAIISSGLHTKEFFADLWYTISSGQLWHGEIQNKAKDGSLYWVDTVIIPIFNEEKKIERYLSLRMLITDRKELEKQRTSYTDLLESIASMVAHEVRGPLCSILGVTDILLNYDNNSEEGRQGIGYLRTSAEQLDLITRKLSQFLRTHEQKTNSK